MRTVADTRVVWRIGNPPRSAFHLLEDELGPGRADELIACCRGGVRPGVANRPPRMGCGVDPAARTEAGRELI